MQTNSVDLAGLAANTVAERLAKEGFNELPSRKSFGYLTTIFRVLKEPMLSILLICSLIYLVLGERNDALMLVASAGFVIGITTFQERRTENALQALKNISSPRAVVIRDNKRQSIFSREIVRGDIVVLQEGVRIPADGIVVESTSLSVDESLLTGESFPVKKDLKGSVYSGTLVTQGRALAQVVSVGINTEMGKIGQSLSEIEKDAPLLQIEIRKLTRGFLLVGSIVGILLVAIIGLTKGNWLQGILSGLTLAMALLPEEFPVVLLIFLTLGAWRISKRNVLTRQTSAIETLGSTTVLCVDKTGTLTTNTMKIGSLMAGDMIFSTEGNQPVPEIFHQVIEYGILSSHNDQFDPIEKELVVNGPALLADPDHIHNRWKLVREYPLSSELLAVSNIWKSVEEEIYVAASKGAPEAIFDLCHLDEARTKQLMERVQTMSDNGMRVIGVARATTKKESVPENQRELDFEFVGLIGFLDPLRETVVDSIRECHEAGIRVIMITGDYPGTALYLAKKIGLKNSSMCITGEELEKMSLPDLSKRINEVCVFARIFPEQKLKIVNALKTNREVVAMTGDGVNDAPALKAANIGIAMGGKGTDVAREAADIILLDDNFSSIVQAIRVGRRIFDNLKKSLSFIFSVHIPIAGMALIPILLGSNPIFFPAHIAFLELIIDPSCSAVFESEKEEKGIMTRPPRDLNKPLFDRRTFIFSLLQGIGLLAIVLIMYLSALYRSEAEDSIRTTVFIIIVFGELLLIITNLSHTQSFIETLRNKNIGLLIVLFGSSVLLSFILTVPALRDLFHFEAVGYDRVVFALLLSILGVSWFEAVKLVRRRKLAV